MNCNNVLVNITGGGYTSSVQIPQIVLDKEAAEKLDKNLKNYIDSLLKPIIIAANVFMKIIYLRPISIESQIAYFNSNGVLLDSVDLGNVYQKERGDIIKIQL